jgi:hypothetical protein
VRFGGEVDDGIDSLFGEDPLHQFGIDDVAFDEAVVGIFFDIG